MEVVWLYMLETIHPVSGEMSLKVMISKPYGLKFHYVILKNVLLCVLYRPPDSKAEWSNVFHEIMTRSRNSNVDIITMGDFNINLFSGENKKWLQDINLQGLTQAVKSPTRITYRTSTLIDHVYTTDERLIINLRVSDITISDHSPIYFTWKHASMKPKTNAHKSIV